MGIHSELFSYINATSVLGFLLFLLILYLLSSKSKENEPPGPRPLPLIGNLLQLDLSKIYLSFFQLSRKYGSVFTVWLGPRKVVILAGYKTVKEALVNNAEAFGERASNPATEREFKGQGLVFSNGETWKELRRFALSNLRDFGMGKKAVELKIIEESAHLVDSLQNFNGKPFDSTQPLNYAVSNIICSLVYGSRFEYSDQQFITMVQNVNMRFKLLNSFYVKLGRVFPFLGRWIKDKQELEKILGDLRDENLSLIQRLRESLNPQLCRGFIDAFLVKQIHLKESGESDHVFHDENLVASVMSLFIAGTETTSTSLKWALLLMIRHPHIQEQVREEICRVIGSRQVQTEDRKDLNFTNAVVHEIQRFANIAPMAIPHRTSQDITFQGYFIKKGTAVIPLLTSVQFDETQWEKPNSFYPAHFLDEDGKFVKKDAFMPFSAGRRACVGEGLARMELFLFFVTLIQRFRFTPPPGVSEEELDLTPQMAGTLSPLPHQICAVSLD